MLRALFVKTGEAVYISHLDLMRVFQRTFARADLHLTHTQGYNPRPSVSIAMPLSLGVSSRCELLDFELDGQDIPCDEIGDRLNEKLIPGVRVLHVYDNGRKVRDLSLLHCTVTLEYDTGVSEEMTAEISALFRRDSLLVTKKGKNGPTQQDIIPMIRRLEVRAGERKIVLDALICCQNPSLNPMQLHEAVCVYLPQWKPDFARCERLEIYDADEKVFR